MTSFWQETQRIVAARPSEPWLTLVSGEGAHVHTYGDLGARVNDYRTRYRNAGLAEGDSVLIILTESLDLFASFFAAMSLGALPAYYAYPSPKQSVEAFVRSIEHLLTYNLVRLVVGFDRVIELLGPRFRGAFTLMPAAAVSRASAALHLPAPSREAFLQFSSGTTGAKKGVLITSQALFNQIEAYGPLVDFDRSSKVVSWLPHYHDMGLIACMLMPFLRQVPIVMMSPFEWVRNPRLLLRAITEHAGTHVWLPNFALGHMTRSIPDADVAGFDLGTLRKIVLCSEPVQHETVAAFLQKFSRCGLDAGRFENCYAMAENTFAMTTTRGGGLEYLDIDRKLFQRNHRIATEAGSRRIVSAGHPLDNIEVKIVDERGAPVGEDVVGEVLIKSNCMLDGYHRNPEATAAALVDGWFRTGDLGFLHEGQLYVTGRKKDMIIVGGENIYPQDIERILNDDPQLIPGRNVVFGVEDPRVGTEKIIVLAEVPDERTPPDVQRIREAILGTLNVAVSDVVFLPHMTLRKGTAGKISRYLNKQAYLESAFAGAVRRSAAPESTVRGVVVAMLPEGTALDETTALLTSGLIDSFGFTELVLKLEQACGLDIPEQLWQVGRFDSIAVIEQTLDLVRCGAGLPAGTAGSGDDATRQASLSRLKATLTVLAGGGPLVERVINRFPLRGTFWYRWLLRLAGIQLGRNVQFLGRVKVKLRGRASNIVIGDNVILADGVDLRNRENGRIQLRERVYLDTNVRVVAARDGIVDIGYGTEIGAGTVINSGGRTTIGEFCMVAGGVNINASRHGTARGLYMKEQAHTHGFVELGDDVWIGSGASILINTSIGTGAVISSNSLVMGRVPEFAICAGVPARVIQYR